MAVGLSGGFVEPLESTGIFLSAMATEYLKLYLQKKTYRNTEKQIINDRMSLMYEEVKDFLMCHYTLSSRNDSDYWKYVRNLDLSDNVIKILELIYYNSDLRDNDVKTRIFPKYGWMCIAMGMNLFRDKQHRLYPNRKISERIYNNFMSIKTQVKQDLKKAYNHLEYLNEFFYK